MLKRFFNIIVILIMSQVVFAGGSISGKIVDSVGQPIAGIGVQARRDFAYIEGSANTDPNGYYQLNNLSLTVYSVVAIPSSSTDYARNVVHNINVTQDIDYPIADIALDNGALSVSGIVTDKNTMTPLNNIWMLCFFKGTWISLYTDAGGEYLITNLPHGTTGILVLPNTAHAGDYIEIELTANVTDLDFALPEESIISGKVIDAITAEPVSGILVEYYNEPYDYTVLVNTDPDGFFTLTHLPPGVVEVVAIPDGSTGYANSLPWGTNMVHLEEGQTLSNRIITLKKGALVSGDVKDHNGDPVTDLEIEFEGRYCEGWQQVDSNGHYELRIPEGTYLVYSDTEDYGYSALWPEVTITDTTVPVIMPDIVVYDDISGGRMSGTILNPGDDPNTGVFLVFAFEAGTFVDMSKPFIWLTIAEAELGSPGPFTLTRLPPGTNYDVYLFIISTTEDNLESGVVRDSVSNVPVGTNDIVLNYSADGGTVKGEVENINGDSILEATVMLNDSTTTKFVAFADCDPNGAYVINNVPSGTYNITAVHGKYLSTTAPTTANVVDATTVNVATIIMPFEGIKEGPDLNGDGFINLADFARLAKRWFSTGQSEEDFDLNNNVNADDLATFLQYWLWQDIWYNN